jgi:hypothetical protein
VKLLLLAVGAVLLLVGACGSVPARAPAPDRFGAPTPSRSLDATARSAAPCGALTGDQLRALELEPSGRLDPLPTGVQACVWEGPGFTRDVSVAFYATRDFLVDTYRSRGMYQRFQPTTIAGFPAVAQQSTAGALSCTVTTGIAVGQAVDVSATELGSAPRPSCETALRVSEAVVANLSASPK